MVPPWVQLRSRCYRHLGLAVYHAACEYPIQMPSSSHLLNSAICTILGIGIEIQWENTTCKQEHEIPLRTDSYPTLCTAPILLIPTHTKRVFATMPSKQESMRFLSSGPCPEFPRISDFWEWAVSVHFGHIFTIASSSHLSPPPLSGLT